ncbi:HVO_2922 family protein [Halorubrum sp. DTA46]|uniref:HVO_2922 family protein n=1 Tax=Halorubrum sp. DTA46 TaxID=3402162 RepID=UPI003AAE30B6
MATDDQSRSGGGLYERRIGTPTTDDEVNGYWLFAFGVLVGILGILAFLFTEPATTARGIAYALAALAPPFLMLGAVIRFPLRRTGTYLGYSGAILSFAAVVWFVNIFPGGWLTASGDFAVISLYGIGLLLIGLAGSVVPLLSDPVYEDYERIQAETAATAAEHDATSTELESTREELQAVRNELAAAEERVEETEAAAEAARAEAAALHESKARFETFEDAGGKARWRLRHRNGNVIATAGQGYSSRGKAQQGLHSVRRNALGAGLLRIETSIAEADSVAADDGPEPDDAEEPDVAIPIDDEDIASDATFELFEDAGGEWRWRLRHDNGNIIGDSGEGYASKSNAKRALSRVRDHVAAADYLRVDPAAFEVYRDKGGQWRWRLIHENGNVLADSGEGYSSRSKARQGLDSVRSNVTDAAVDDLDADTETTGADADSSNAGATFELYEDKAAEYRWRLRHRNGNVIADSGEGYASKSGAKDAIERVRKHAAAADVLEVGNAAFEIYEDAGGEWRWRLRHRNGNILGDSGEGYASRSSAVEAVTNVKSDAPGAGEETVE